MQNLESALTPYHMAYMFHLFRLTGGFQFCLQVCLQRRTVERYYAHLRDSVDGSQWKRLQLFSPPWWTAGENRFNPRWKSLNKRAKSSKPFQVCSRPCCPSYRWREGTGAWHALAAVVMVAGWSVASPAPALSLCRSGCLFSLSFFPFPPHPPLSVSVSLSLPPPVPLLRSRSPPLRHPGCFCACCHLKSCLVLQNYQRCSISPLTLVCCLRFLSWAFFLQVFGWRTRQACGA